MIPLRVQILGLFLIVVICTAWMLEEHTILQENVISNNYEEIMKEEELDYTFCDGNRQAVLLPQLNVTVHLFEFSIFRNPFDNITHLHILAFVLDLDRPHKMLFGSLSMSDRISLIEFTGKVRGVELEFKKRTTSERGGMILEADLGSKLTEKIQLELIIDYWSQENEVLHKTQIELASCKQHPKKYDIASVLIPLFGPANLESLFEWISHHLNVGVNHFLIYSRNATYDPILQPLIDADIITWKYFPPFTNFSREYNDQAIIYTHAMMQNRYSMKWMLFHDLDEFIVSTDVVLPKVLSRLCNEPAIELRRLSFASDSPLPGEYQFEKWLKRKSLENWEEGKMIVQPRYSWWQGIHYSHIDGYFPMRYEFGSANCANPFLSMNAFQLRYNHYTNMFNIRFLEKDLKMPQIQDETALHYVPYLNTTHWMLMDCARGDITQCGKLKNIHPVFMPLPEHGNRF